MTPIEDFLRPLLPDALDLTPHPAYGPLCAPLRMPHAPTGWSAPYGMLTLNPLGNNAAGFPQRHKKGGEQYLLTLYVPDARPLDERQPGPQMAAPLDWVPATPYNYYALLLNLAARFSARPIGRLWLLQPGCNNAVHQPRLMAAPVDAFIAGLPPAPVPKTSAKPAPKTSAQTKIQDQ